MREKSNNIMFVFILTMSLLSIFYVVYYEFFMIR